MTIDESLREAAHVLREGGVADARREAASLLTHALGRDRAFLLTHGPDELDDGALALFRRSVARRAVGEPLQYITGHQEFFKLDFDVTPDVLIPRPETELLVETALELLRGAERPRICDVGTGSGCIVVSLLHERADARAVAVDISPAALRVATRNAERHGVSDRLLLLESDCFAALDRNGTASTRFEMVVSNPPYITEQDIPGLQREVREHEPRAALTPGGDGLDVIRRLLRDAPGFLAHGGHLLFEIGFEQHELVERMVDRSVWELVGIREDLQAIPRVVVLRRKG